MDFALSDDQQNIRDAILKLCSGFSADYWLERDRSGEFPQEFFNALVEGGWLGIAMPTEYGGSGLGITEAAVMMQAIAESGAGMTGASSVHIPVFSVQPVVLFGTEEQKSRILPRVVTGEDRVCFGVTEPNAGLNTTEIKTRAERRDGGYLINGEKIWISTAQ
ncbi:acyl-CoA dehydrogenase family protein, partial [uncultured Abyssibacter sp.]|uniref:acyl-CoA dehydrogenase family protein n=1 Tax=uncultured Abyssibacter sp. TaxID=2320202 RepID=UPI0032B1C0ED